ncbi:MAG: AAA family ATPase [Deltaproteobacteria bacterium]|nr:AAA family ATPase [Deltaproteobacteria bacterium]
MRPLRLVMTAIGPFVAETAIDFDRFKRGDLFLVHGPTGSGKSFVFDAICYALFGETPSGRSSHLRSDYARRDIEPSIEFAFSLGGEVYRVVRRLEYQRVPKRRSGSDTIWQRESGQLEKLASWPDGEPRLLTAKKSEIRKKCVELLGLDADQFFQVVVLPQGDFQRVLLADTSEREALLERLFDAVIYAEVQNQLSEQRQDKERALRDDIKLKQLLFEEIKTALPLDPLSHADSLDSSLMSVAIKRIASELPAFEVKVAESTAALNQSSEALAAARELARRFQEQDDLTIAAKTLETQGQYEIEPLERAFFADRQAARIMPEIERFEACKQQTRRVAEELRALERALDNAADALRSAQREASRIEELNKTRESLAAQIARLQPVIAVSRELDQLEMEYSRVEKAYNRQTRAFQEVEGKYQSLKADLKRLEAECKSLCSDTDDSAGVQAVLGRAETHLIRLHRMQELLKKRAERERRGLEKQAQKESLLHELSSLRKRWEKDIAGQLAARLEDGRPCPVCGSQSHPRPAGPADKEVSQEAIRNAQDRISDTERQLAEIAASIEQIDIRARETRAELIQTAETHGDWPVEQPNAFADVVARLREELVLHEVKKQKLSELEKRIETIRFETLPQTERSLSEAIEKRDASKGAYLEIALRVNEKKRIWEAEAGASDESRQADTGSRERYLRQRLIQIEADHGEISERISKLREAHQQALLVETATREKADGKRERLRILSMEQETQRLLCEKTISDSPFADAEQVKTAYQSDEWRNSAASRIDAFKQKQAENTALRKRLAQQLEGEQAPNLEQLEQNRQLKEKLNREDILRSQEARRRLVALQKARREIKRLDERYRVLQEQLKILGKLADQVRGQGKPKISLKRFFLAQRLEEVLIQASYRLNVLSRGRFLLKRDREEKNEHASGQTGLNLNVFDNYTGVERPACTLSGGQIFLASLSLALGLADVVHARSGGVAVESLFIDEGFASLDEETLQLALEVLNQLRQGRMVGVISHVNELKRQIGNRIEIIESGIGSTARIIQDDI